MADKTDLAVGLGARQLPAAWALAQLKQGRRFKDDTATLALTLTDQKRLKFFAEVKGEMVDGAGQSVGVWTAPIAAGNGRLKEFQNIDDAVRTANRAFNIPKFNVVVDLPVKSEQLSDPKTLAEREKSALTKRLADYNEKHDEVLAHLETIAAWQAGTAAQRARYTDATLSKQALEAAIAVTTERIDDLTAIINA